MKVNNLPQAKLTTILNILFFMLTALLSYSQVGDTIVFKNGTVLEVKNISLMQQNLNYIYYIPLKEDNKLDSVSVSDIQWIRPKQERSGLNKYFERMLQPCDKRSYGNLMIKLEQKMYDKIVMYNVWMYDFEQKKFTKFKQKEIPLSDSTSWIYENYIKEGKYKIELLRNGKVSAKDMVQILRCITVQYNFYK